MHFRVLFACSIFYGNLAQASPSLVSLTPDATDAQAARPTCILNPRGDELHDDGRDAYPKSYGCRDGGVLVIPAGTTFMIRSPVNFDWCNGCEIQVEGTIKMSDNYEYWNEKPEMMSIYGMKNLTIRSVTGQGLIDGNMAVTYQRFRWPDWFGNLPTLIHINGSSNVYISNLKIKNAPDKFIRVDGASSDISFSDLDFVVEGQYFNLAYTMGHSIGLEVLNSSRITASNLNVKFSSDKPDAKVGTCVTIGENTDTVEVSNVTCNAGDGVMVKFVSYSGAATIAKNIHVSNLTANVSTATGIRFAVGERPELRNITWDGVTVLDGNAATAEFCWQDVPSWTARCNIANEITRANLTGIYWKNIKGKVDPNPSLRCANSKSFCDYHFQNWTVSNVSRPLSIRRQVPVPSEHYLSLGIE